MDEFVNGFGESLYECAESRRFLVQDRSQDAPRVASLMGCPARDHAVGRGAERVDVRPRVRGRAPRQFGGEEVRRAEDLPALTVDVRLFHLDREAEVGDLGGAVRVPHQVVGLDVAVDDAPRFGVDKARSRVPQDSERLAPVEAPFRGEVGLHGAPVHVLHGEVVLACLFTDVVDRDDVGVIELRRGARLLAEAIDERGVPCELGSEDLHRDLAVEAGLRRAQDEPHRASAEFAVDPVAGDVHRAAGAWSVSGSCRSHGRGGGLARTRR